MHHFPEQRMQNSSGRNDLTGSNGTRNSIQDEDQSNLENGQHYGQDVEIGYNDPPTPLTFEDLEQRFLDEIMKLASEQHDAEKAESTRHKEKILEINTKYQESFSALRAQQAARREEFLRMESQGRLDHYHQDGRNCFPNMRMPTAHGNIALATIPTTVAVANDAMPRFPESDSAAIETTTDSRFSVRTSEPAVSSAAPTSLPTSTSSTFNFGNSPSQNIGPSTTSPLFPSPFPLHVSNNSTSPNFLSSSSLSATTPLTNSSMTSSASAVTASTGFATSTRVSPLNLVLARNLQQLGLPLLFGSSVNATFSSGSTLFVSSSPAISIFNSSPTFGLGTSASSSAADSVSSNSNTSSSLLGQSSWQLKFSYGSTPTFNSSSSSSGFSFGASTASVSSSPTSPMVFASSSPAFTFTSASATNSTQPAFNSNPIFAFSSASPVNNDQMSTKDSMAEDIVQATPTVTPVFGQLPAPPQSTFAFGVVAPSGGCPFQFGTQENITPRSQSPFQPSGSLEFTAGGSFSLGTGGSDKSGRRILRVGKNKNRRMRAPPQSTFAIGAAAPSGASSFQFGTQENITPEPITISGFW